MKIAYFSMEIGLSQEIPTYSGGLGVLAGDTLKAAADLNVPMLGMTLLYRDGYFFQKINDEGWQEEETVSWDPLDFLEKLPVHISIHIEGREVQVAIWRYVLTGVHGFSIPIYFLDTDNEENSLQDRQISKALYSGDPYMRLCQEMVLGIGGIRALDALSYHNIEKYHMNEGHASFLIVELLDQRIHKLNKNKVDHDDVEFIKHQCVFTTHTPVPAGFDKFPLELVHKVLGYPSALELDEVFCCGLELNMTYLALNVSHYINGVAKQHGKVSKEMFPNYSIDSITNGVHVASWLSRPFVELFNHYIPGWQEDNYNLRYALNIPREELWNAHQTNKKKLIQLVNREYNKKFDLNTLTLGFARRAATYKRADLLFFDLDRLKQIANKFENLQIVYAGKAHPKDQFGKELIHSISQIINTLPVNIQAVYLENYDMTLGSLITSGVDVWLNTPEPPMEASGTSGMKAAVNGVPSLSVLDGWWIEGCVEGVTGWSIGPLGLKGDRRQIDAESLYDQLENKVFPSYLDKDLFIPIMAHSISLNGSFFNTHRMIQQYIAKAYFI